MSELESALGTRLLFPRDREYEVSRRVWNAMHDRRPALIARCRTAAEVSLALRYALAENLRVTVRGGGHNVAGTAVADNAVMIDLSLMSEVAVDVAGRLAHAGGGCLLRDLDAATTPLGLACPAGVVSHTGLGGLALGGGYGWLARKWGLTCDHIMAVEIVLPDGSIVEATEDQYHDLLWALRGGGGNFGIVTRFTLRLRPCGPVHLHSGAYTLDAASAALAAYGDFAERQCRDLHTVGSLAYPGVQEWIPEKLRHEPLLFLTAAWFGDLAEAQARTAPLFETAVPEASRIRTLTYPELQSLGDHGEPHGHRYYTKSCYLREFPAGVAASFVAAGRDIRSRRSSIDFEFLRGAMTDVPDEKSAFPHRDAPYIFTASAQWTDPEDDAENIAWSRRSVNRLREFQSAGVYVNYVHDENAKATDVYGAERYRRLAEVKQRYDPENILRHNQNIAPAPTTAP
ncbi:FAD-binding oxidoreductase [Nonomuraea bangladeshensis]